MRQSHKKRVCLAKLTAAGKLYIFGKCGSRVEPGGSGGSGCSWWFAWTNCQLREKAGLPGQMRQLGQKPDNFGDCQGQSTEANSRYNQCRKKRRESLRFKCGWKLR